MKIEEKDSNKILLWLSENDFKKLYELMQPSDRIAYLEMEQEGYVTLILNFFENPKKFIIAVMEEES